MKGDVVRRFLDAGLVSFTLMGIGAGCASTDGASGAEPIGPTAEAPPSKSEPSSAAEGPIAAVAPAALELVGVDGAVQRVPLDRDHLIVRVGRTEECEIMTDNQSG